MNIHPITLSQYSFETELEHPELSGLGSLLEDVASACKRVAHECSRGALRGVEGYASTENVQGEAQKKIDIVANDIFIAANQWGGHVSALISEEMDTPWFPKDTRKGPFLLFFDPLDGSSNSDVNAPVGSIFSVMRAPEGYMQNVYESSWALRKGCEQIAAGYALYGPATILVLTIGHGTHGFTLDRDIGEFISTHPNMKIAQSAKEFAINASNWRHWEAPMQQYIEECLQGQTGTRGKDFNMRWLAALVGECHRILTRGGVFAYPFDKRDPAKPGKLRLMYECNPIAMLVEQAEGLASTGRMRIMDVLPNSLHQRVPFIFGAAKEVSYIEQLHQNVPNRP